MSGWTASAADLQEALRFAADPITIQAADGRLVYANEAAARQMGFDSPDELIRAPIGTIMERYELLDESGAPLPLESLPGRRALRGEPEPTALVGFRLGGERDTRWSLVQATPVIRDGEVRFVVNAFQDVTGLKRTEERLRLLADVGAVLGSAADYQTTLQALAETVVPAAADWCVIDILEGGGLYRVAVAHPDPAMRAVAEELERGYPPDATRPGGVGQVLRTGEALIIEEITEQILAAASRGDRHLALLRQLGLRSAAILPLRARGQVLGAMTLAGSDSGHRYRSEDQPFLEELAGRAAYAIDNARLLHEANEAIRLRDDFLAMASHDMRTPLQAILGNIQLARRRLARAAEDEKATTELARNLANAERTTDKLTRLVAELMDVSMLRSGQNLPLEPRVFDLAALAAQVAEDHQSRAERHRIRVTGEESLVGEWDQGRVERVLDNLVDNAVKYSPGGGDVVVEVASEDAHASVSVTDHGIGIPASELGGIFEPYRRGSNASMLRGIGLGLAGCRAVLEQLGGELTVESSEGVGSTFRVRLPNP